MKYTPALFLFLSQVSLMAQEYHEVQALEISPRAEDYAPLPMEGGLIMSSHRENGSAINYRNAANGGHLSDLYFVPLENGVAGEPRALNDAINTPVNEGPADVTDGGRTLCFTRNLDPRGARGKARPSGGQLGLFFSELENGKWGQAVPFMHNSERYAVMHPTFGPQGDTLVFASDMPGGYGGFDLYLSVRTADGWTLPTNLGPSVNTAANEVYPRWSWNGDLYISSDRPGGHGGLDILTTRHGAGGWQQPVALPEPVNSPANDHGYAVIPGSRRALFTSDRSGTDAIHMANITLPRFAGCTPQKEDNFCFLFRKPAHPLTGKVALDHVWEMGDGTRIIGAEARHCYAGPGIYTVRSLLADRSTGDVFHVLQERAMELNRTRQAYILSPDSIRTGAIAVFDATNSHLPGIMTEGHRWDMGDGTTSEGTRLMHQYRAQGAYHVLLDIVGTDAGGVLKSHCVMKTIVVMDGHGFEDDRTVSVVSAGISTPVRNFTYQELPSEVFKLTTEEQEDVKFSVTLFARKERISLEDPVFLEVRKLYRVVEHYDPEQGVYLYVVGETDDLEEAYGIFKTLRDLHFMEADVFVIQEDKLLDMSRLEMVSRRELDRARVSTQAVHFGFNSATIEADGDAVLMPIVAMMKKHPDMQLVVEAHTDDIGSVVFNMELSEARARAVTEALVSHGIAPERLTAIGHGKNKPVATNRTEDGRKANRRVDFRIVMPGEMQTTGFSR